MALLFDGSSCGFQQGDNIIGITSSTSCLCVCVKSHLTSGASVGHENAVTHSAGNEGQSICGVFSETAPLQRSNAPSLTAFFLRITRMRIVHTQVLRVRDVMLGLHAVSSSCVLYSFRMIILRLERVVSCWLSVSTRYLRDCFPA